MTLKAYFFLTLRTSKNVVRYMCKKSRFRIPFQKEHGKRVSTLFKFEQQHLYHIYCAFSKFTLNFGHFPKKDDPHNLFLSEARPAKSVVRYMCKSPASDYPSKRNKGNGSQLCLNLSDTTCGIFITQREGNLVAKSLF